ncbi:MAG TPA: thiol peroxidase, partial [Sulfuricaulis sp.]|nr:thiol peroxidase [Sulfuricaulis sp.]
MANITHRGNPVRTNGDLPAVGSRAPDFRLTDADLKDLSLADFRGKKKLLNIFPSIDTPTCALSTRKFNEHAKQHADAVIIMVSADLPFAQKRFCSAENTMNVKTLSMMRDRNFAKDYGVLLQDGLYQGITARAIVVIDE